MTRRRALVLARAVRDLEEIAAYLDVEAPQARSELVGAILEAIEGLEPHAHRGPVARDPVLASRGFRAVRAGRYVVFCKIEGRVVRVYRVLHERRSWAGLL